MNYRGLIIDCIDDIGENKGGYYCKVYLDNSLCDSFEDFCIYPEQVEENPDVDYWIKKYIDESYESYVAEELVPQEMQEDKDQQKQQEQSLI